jgi:hydrogenase/urease accessory protein HupE
MFRVVLVLVTLAVLAPAVRAHDESVSTSDVEIREHEIVWKADLGVAGLAKVVALPAPERPTTAAAAIGAFVQQALQVRANGTLLNGQLGPLETIQEPTSGTTPELGRVVQTVVFRSDAPITQVTARVAFFSKITQQHRALIRVRWGDQARQFVRLGQTELTLDRAELSPSVWRLGWEFFRWGLHHIVVGYDHVLFLLALLLAVTRWRELVVIVTSFTLAHSVTLLLSAWQLVTVSSRLTEVLIAASIVYVAAENLTRATRPPRHRALFTFAFGLVHGLGFATELRDRLAEMSGSVVGPVLAFNLGVECGQLALVALAFPVILRLRRAPTPAARAQRQARIVVIGSIPILLAGLFWMIERLSG